MQPNAERAYVCGVLHVDCRLEQADDGSRGLGAVKRLTIERHRFAKVGDDFHIGVWQYRRRRHRSTVAGDAPVREDHATQGSGWRPFAIVDVHALDRSDMDATSLAILRCRVAGAFAPSMAATCLRFSPNGRRSKAALASGWWRKALPRSGG